jgi:hypothetical protein
MEIYIEQRPSGAVPAGYDATSAGGDKPRPYNRSGLSRPTVTLPNYIVLQAYRLLC